MNAILRSGLVVCVVVVAACALPEQQADNELYKAPIYRTGSNLPAGRESGDPTKEMSAAERKTLDDLQNRPRTPAVKTTN